MQLTSCTRHTDAQLLLWPVRLKLILGQLGTLIYVLYGVRHAEVQVVQCSSGDWRHRKRSQTPAAAGYGGMLVESRGWDVLRCTDSITGSALSSAEVGFFSRIRPPVKLCHPPKAATEGATACILTSVPQPMLVEWKNSVWCAVVSVAVSCLGEKYVTYTCAGRNR